MYKNTDALINAFLYAVYSNITIYPAGAPQFLSASKKSFFKNYCGIDIGNENTAAITGSDVSCNPADLKTKNSIVPENGDFQTPTSTSFTQNGLTEVFDKIQDDDPFKKQKQIIINGLYNRWIEAGLNLVEKSYGISFNDAVATVKKINLAFFRILVAKPVLGFMVIILNNKKNLR